MTIKILVVDDEPDFANLVKQKFRKQIKDKKYTLVFASNGKEGLEKIDADNTIDVVLTDLNMPVMSGLEFLENLNTLGRLLTTVVVSAYGDMKNIRAAMNLGVYDFVTKPIDFEILENVVDKTFNHSKVIRDAESMKQEIIELNMEMKIAKQMQEKILPNKLPDLTEHSHIQVFGKVVQSEVIGGDCFDLITKGNDQLEFFVADVAGKSISGTMLMSIVKTFMHFISLKSTLPQQVMYETNQFMISADESNLFVTSFLAVMDVNTGQLIYCNAGHRSPLVLRQDGTVEEIKGELSPALGMVKEDSLSSQMLFKEQQYQLHPKDMLLLFSDGVTETFNQAEEMYGIEHLKEHLKKCTGMSCEEVIESILKNIEDFREGQPQTDDMTLLAIYYGEK